MKNLLKRVFDFVRNKYKSLFDLVRINSETAVKVTAKLKEIVESPITDIITDIIPGDLDDKIHEKLKVVVPKIATKVAIAHGILSVETKDSDAVTSIIDHLKNELNPGLRISFWVMFSGELNKALSDDKITLAEAIGLSQLIYAEMKK
jgi:hypothetical protein